MTSHVCFEPRKLSREALFENYLRVREGFCAYPRIASRFAEVACHTRGRGRLFISLAVNLAFRRGARILRKKVKDGVKP